MNDDYWKSRDAAVVDVQDTASRLMLGQVRLLDIIASDCFNNLFIEDKPAQLRLQKVLGVYGLSPVDVIVPPVEKRFLK